MIKSIPKVTSCLGLLSLLLSVSAASAQIHGGQFWADEMAIVPFAQAQIPIRTEEEPSEMIIEIDQDVVHSRTGNLWIGLEGGWQSSSELLGGSEASTTFNRDLKILGARLGASLWLSHRFVVDAQLPFYSLQTAEDINPEGVFADTLQASSMSKLGNTSFGLRYVLQESARSAMEAGLRCETNTGTLDQLSGLQTAFNATTLAPWLRLRVGAGRQADLDLFASVLVRNNEHSEAFQGSVQYRYAILSGWRIQGALHYRKAFRNGDYGSGNVEQSGLFLHNQDYAQFSLRTELDLSDRWTVTAAAQQVFWGEQVNEGLRLTAGLRTHFDVW